MEAAEPLMRWDVISRVFHGSAAAAVLHGQEGLAELVQGDAGFVDEDRQVLGGDLVVFQAGETIAGGGVAAGAGGAGDGGAAATIAVVRGPRRAGAAPGSVQRLLGIRLRGCLPFRSRRLQQAGECGR